MTRKMEGLLKSRYDEAKSEMVGVWHSDDLLQMCDSPEDTDYSDTLWQRL